MPFAPSATTLVLTERLCPFRSLGYLIIWSAWSEKEGELESAERNTIGKGSSKMTIVIDFTGMRSMAFSWIQGAIFSFGSGPWGASAPYQGSLADWPSLLLTAL